MRLNICLFTLALTMAFVLLLPPIARLQSLGAAEQNTALQGTRLTYYQRPTVGQCQADCANNPNCKGFTWIQAGTYNARDAAMCYLMSAVTGRTSARNHTSAVKVATGGTGTGYLGCYKDTADFDVKGSIERSRTNTPARCIESCRQKGFAYAAVQYGESCLCGNSYGKYGKADNCNYKCTGDPGQICGGYNANSVYATGGGSSTGGSTLSGDWDFSCCDGAYTGILRLTSQDGATFSGSFESIQAGGAVRNGQVRGNRIDFDRIASGFQQHYSAQLLNDGGRLKMINGVWSGAYQELGRTNWHAEKK